MTRFPRRSVNGGRPSRCIMARNEQLPSRPARPHRRFDSLHQHRRGVRPAEVRPGRGDLASLPLLDRTARLGGRKQQNRRGPRQRVRALSGVDAWRTARRHRPGAERQDHPPDAGHVGGDLLGRHRRQYRFRARHSGANRPPGPKHRRRRHQGSAASLRREDPFRHHPLPASGGRQRAPLLQRNRL